MNNNKQIISMTIVFIIATLLGFCIVKLGVRQSSNTTEIAEMEKKSIPDKPETGKTKGNMDSLKKAQEPNIVNVVDVNQKEEDSKPVAKVKEPIVSEVKESTPQKAVITKEDFQSKLQNLKNRELDPGKGIVSRNLSIKTVNMSSEEQHKPTDIEAIRNKIRFNAWQGVTVLNISYDKNGMVNSITVQPIYQ